MIFQRNAVYAVSLLAFAFVAFIGSRLGRRSLAEDSSSDAQTPRALQQYPYNPYLTHTSRPAQMALYCPVGSKFVEVNWGDVALQMSYNQQVTLPDGNTMYITRSGSACAPGAATPGNSRIRTWIENVVYREWVPNNVPGFNNQVLPGDTNSNNVDTSTPAKFPSTGFCITEFVFQEPVDSAFFSVGGITSKVIFSNAVRISMFNANGSPNDLYMAKTGTSLRVVDNYAYQTEQSMQVNDDPGLSSLYAKSNSKVKRIRVEDTALTFVREYAELGNGYGSGMTIYPGLDFGYCAPTDETQPPIPAGTSGDPIIMGLSGQIFKFNGRSGAWYSAASAKSFQWNMKIQQFEDCPDTSNTFITGVGLTVFADRSKKSKEHKIEVNVVNEHSTAVGCGNSREKNNDFGCLGAGSLELTIDGHKVVQSVDHKFPDHSGRVIAFNTIAKCSRRWFDFDITPASEIGGGAASISRGRQLKNNREGDGVLSILEGIKDTMVDKDGCEAWMQERKSQGDLFQQTGTWSTIIIKTNKISFHIEYKQEQERCGAHSLDVWISEVSPDVLKEKWLGVVGETKKTGWRRTQAKNVDRAKALKHPDDESYEVISPFSRKCKACV